MKTRLILTLTFLFLLLPLANAANDFAYNRLYEDGQIIDGLNYSINVNHSTTSDYATLAGDSLLFNGYSLFNYINSYVRSQGLVCFLTGGADCTMEGDILMGGNGIYNTDFVEIKANGASPEDPILNLSNSNTYGTTLQSFYNDVGDNLDIGIFGYGLSQLLFPDQLDINDSAMGISNYGGDLWLATTENHSIRIGGSPDRNLSNVEFGISIEPETGAVVFQGDKKIIPKRADGGYAMVFDSEDVLDAGAFPFVFEAQDANNETIILSWQQNGANNSFSGQLNSFVAFPKNWMLSTNPSMNTDNVTFLFNTSNYPELCSWLQTNLSLMPEGCEYFADTTGRGVPLIAGGDLEIWRTATIHEGITTYDTLDFIGRDGNDVNMLFNDGLENGKLHIRDRRTIFANITDFDRIITDFDDGTISPFESFSIAPEVGRDWDSVSSIFCHQDRCANAAGGNIKKMCVSDGTQNAENINISFWLTTSFGVGDVLFVDLDNNEGDTATVFTESNTVIDTFNSFIMPLAFENKSNITTCFTLDGQNSNRQAWIDIIRVQATFNPAIEINNSYDGGRIVLGEDRGDDSCGMYVDQFVNNDTLQPDWRLNLKCSNVNLIGNVTQTDVTEVEINVTDNVTANNFIARENYYYEDGSKLNDTFFRVDGTSQMQGNANIGGYNITNVDFINATGNLLVGENPAYQAKITSASDGTLGLLNDIQWDQAAFLLTDQFGNLLGFDGNQIVSNAVPMNIQASNPAGYFRWMVAQDATNYGMVLDAQKRLSINKNSPTATLDVGGDALIKDDLSINDDYSVSTNALYVRGTGFPVFTAESKTAGTTGASSAFRLYRNNGVGASNTGTGYIYSLNDDAGTISNAVGLYGYFIDNDVGVETGGFRMGIGQNGNVGYAPQLFSSDGLVLQDGLTTTLNWADTANNNEILSILEDNRNMCFGESRDACIGYNSTDLVIDPNNVGSGDLYVSSNMGTSGDINSGGDVNIDSQDNLNFGSLTPLNSGFDQQIRIEADTNLIGGLDFKNIDPTGQVRFMARDDLDNYMVMGTPNNQWTGSTWMGVPREDGFWLWAYAPQNTSKILGLGTISPGDVVIGTNNIERINIDGSSGEVTIVEDMTLQKDVSVSGNIKATIGNFTNITIGDPVELWEVNNELQIGNSTKVHGDMNVTGLLYGNGSQLSGITTVNTTPTSGDFGFWSRSGSLIQTATSGDDITLGGTFISSEFGLQASGTVYPTFRGAPAYIQFSDSSFNPDFWEYKIEATSDTLEFQDNAFGLNNGFSFNDDIQAEGAISVGSNTLTGLSSGDINVSTVYYDTLTAKSPLFQCSDDWCSVTFPKNQKTLYIEKDENYTVLDIVYNDVHYTKSEFNTQFCQQNEDYGEICTKLNDKVKRLSEKATCNNAGYEYVDGICFDTVKQTTNYANAITTREIELYDEINKTCQKLGVDLQIESYDCTENVLNGQTATQTVFKEDCNWNVNDGYYCMVKQEITL